MLLDVNSIKDRPATYNGTMEDKVAWLKWLHTLSIPTNKDDIAEVAATIKGDPYGYCNCAKGKIHALFIKYNMFETQI